ncbi:MAG: hypothetical protein ACLSA6_19630 [Holdemania massiliensis]
MALTLKQLKMTPKRTELLEKMGLTDSDAILMCVPLRYQCREVVPYEQWQVKSEVILEGQIVRPARSMRIRGGKTMTKFQLENEDDCLKLQSLTDLGQAICPSASGHGRLLQGRARSPRQLQPSGTVGRHASLALKA